MVEHFGGEWFYHPAAGGEPVDVSSFVEGETYTPVLRPEPVAVGDVVEVYKPFVVNFLAGFQGYAEGLARLMLAVDAIEWQLKAQWAAARPKPLSIDGHTYRRRRRARTRRRAHRR